MASSKKEKSVQNKSVNKKSEKDGGSRQKSVRPDVDVGKKSVNQKSSKMDDGKSKGKSGKNPQKNPIHIPRKFAAKVISDPENEPTSMAEALDTTIKMKERAVFKITNVSAPYDEGEDKSQSFRTKEKNSQRTSKKNVVTNWSLRQAMAAKKQKTSRYVRFNQKELEDDADYSSRYDSKTFQHPEMFAISKKVAKNKCLYNSDVSNSSYVNMLLKNDSSDSNASQRGAPNTVQIDYKYKESIKGKNFRANIKINEKVKIKRGKGGGGGGNDLNENSSSDSSVSDSSLSDYDKPPQKTSNKVAPTSPDPSNSQLDCSSLNRYLVTIRSNKQDNLSQVIGIIYGCIENYPINDNTKSEHRKNKMVVCDKMKSDNRLFRCVDLSFVDSWDNSRDDLIAEIEQNQATITIIPTVESHAVIYDNKDGGILLNKNSLARFNGSLISFQALIAVENDNCVPTGEYKQQPFEPNAPHKIEILTGMANFVICADKSKFTLFLMIHCSKDTGVTVDDSITWDTGFDNQSEDSSSKQQPQSQKRSSKKSSQQSSRKSSIQETEDVTIPDDSSKYNIVDFMCSKMAEFQSEYLVYIRTTNSTKLIPTGVVIGTIEGQVMCNQVFFCDQNESLLWVVMMDYNNSILVEERKQIYRYQPIEILLEDSIICNLFADIGGGFILSGGSRLMVVGTSLMKIYLKNEKKPNENNAQNVPGVQDSYYIQDTGVRNLYIDSGEVSIIIRNNGVVGFFRHLD